MAPAARIRTPVTELLGIEHPILLAAMGDTAGGHLAAAVSTAGGLGMIGGGYADVDWLDRELANAGAARVGVGFITFALDARPRALDVALDAGVPIVQLSFGDPAPFVERIRAAGALLVCQVQSDDDIQRAIGAGADALIAQGQDAGGHGRPDRATMGLVPSIVDEVGDTPVIAAGGIADGRGLAAALALGAGGVCMGTRFVATPEAISTTAEGEALLAGRSQDTVRTPVFDLVRGPEWPEGHDGRAVRNDLVDEWAARVAAIEPQRERLRQEYLASAADDYSMRALWAGEGLDLIGRLEPAGDIVRRVIDEAVTHLRRAGDMVRDA